MILLKYSEPHWLALLLIGIPVCCAVIAFYIEKSQWDEETKRLMKEYQRTYNNKKPPAETRGEKQLSNSVNTQ